MGMKELKQRFQRINGVSLDYFDKNPEKLEAFFSVDGRCKRGKVCSQVGRGYPFFDKERINAEEKDKQNMEILSRW